MPTPKNQNLRSLLLGGLLPIVIYTILEEKVGPLWSLIFAMGFGLLEIAYEAFKYRKVETITWVGNALLVGMGGVSLVTQEGIWFKLQPAILELGMALMLVGSCIFEKPLLVMMARKQQTFQSVRPELLPVFEERFRKITLRLGIFFLLHAVLATYAAFSWSTRSWALLKGVGLTISMILFMALEVFFLRKRLNAK